MREIRRMELLGREVIFLDEVESTNTLLAGRDDLLLVDGLAVIADRQTHGRGKWGRSWEQGTGDHLFASVVVHADFLGEDFTALTLLVGLAVFRAFSRLGVPNISLKWPNDVLVKGKKVCGILCESRNTGCGRVAVAGIGINISGSAGQFSQDIREKAGTLESLTGRRWGREEILEAILLEMDAIREETIRKGLTTLLLEWEGHSSSIGSEVVLDGAVGRVTGIDPSGRLLVELQDGRIRSLVSCDIPD